MLTDVELLDGLKKLAERKDARADLELIATGVARALELAMEASSNARGLSAKHNELCREVEKVKNAPGKFGA